MQEIQISPGFDAGELDWHEFQITSEAVQRLDSAYAVRIRIAQGVPREYFVAVLEFFLMKMKHPPFANKNLESWFQQQQST